MTPDEAARCAEAANRLRPDWPVGSLLTFIRTHLQHRAYGDVAVALTWICTKTQTRTPRLILEAGPWWQAAVADDPSRSVRQPPRAGADPECRIHVGEFADSCRACAADQLAGDERSRPARPVPRLPAEAVRQHAQAARQALHANQEDE